MVNHTPPLVSILNEGKLQETDCLLLEPSAHMKQPDRDAVTALHTAAYKGDVQFVRYLLAKDINVNQINKFGWTALHIAAQQGHLDVVRSLLDVKRRLPGFQWAPFYSHAHKARLELVPLEHEVDLNQANHEGETPLHLAALHGHLDVVGLLLAHRADLQQTDNSGFTPLCRAVQQGHFSVVCALLEAGANIRCADGAGNTPLHCAVDHGELDLVRLLLDWRADINQENKAGLPPLHLAVYSRHFFVVSLLLERGANFNQANNRGHTPLYIATVIAAADLVCLLALYGAEPAQASETPKVRAIRELGNCLRAAEREVEHPESLEVEYFLDLEEYSQPEQGETVSPGSITDKTRARWAELHARNPWLYSELPRLSLKLHSQSRGYFGLYAERQYFNGDSTSVGRPAPKKKTALMRQAALDYPQEPGQRFSRAPEWCHAVNRLLREEGGITQPPLVRLKPYAKQAVCGSEVSAVYSDVKRHKYV